MSTGSLSRSVADRLPDLSGLVTMDRRLREVAADRPAVERAANAARERLGDPVLSAAERVATLGYLGNAERILGNHGAAIATLEECVAHAQHLDDANAQATALIRLGEALRCADRAGESEDLLRAAVAGTEGGSLHDFALQHLGKCLTDQSRTEEAIAVLEHALRLRQEKGDPDLVASTEAALERALASRPRSGA
jgi:tetratricopeptide (TPR) repeat protein